jgi:5-methylcytosine-specific restriction endonuclease McrA
VTFTAGAELHDKLERLQALTRSSIPDGDLGKVIELAVTRELERQEARRFARAKRPRKTLASTDTRPRTRHIPAPVRRAVQERDRGQCTYRDRRGRRCSQRHNLEFHHRDPFGRGGDHRPENIALLCRTHNALLAERDYGKDVMERLTRAADRAPGTDGVEVSSRGRHLSGPPPARRAGPTVDRQIDRASPLNPSERP